VEFLGIDEDLLAVAAEMSPDIAAAESDGPAEWIAALTAAENDTPLTMVANGNGVGLPR
jgi:hypothetical protein